jgi:hypothetical protein
MMNLFQSLSSLFPIPSIDLQSPWCKLRFAMDNKGKKLSPTLQDYMRQVYLRMLKQQ